MKDRKLEKRWKPSMRKPPVDRLDFLFGVPEPFEDARHSFLAAAYQAQRAASEKNERAASVKRPD